MFIPSVLETIFVNLSVAFTEPTANRMTVLMVGTILAHGRRTVTTALRAVWPWVEGHFSNYHRVFSRGSWSPWVLAEVLAELIIELMPIGEVIPVAVDETVGEHKGPKIYGRSCHRDAVRSSQRHKAYRYGHKWVTLGIVIKFPFARSPWCLPIMAALYCPQKLERAEKRRHKAPSQLARQMLICLIRQFPDRRFVLLGDGAYATFELADFCSRHNHPLVSHFRTDAALYAPPPPYRKGRKGRPPRVGKRLDTPEEAASRKNADWKEATVGWYGGGTRTIRLLTGTALWYRRGRKRVPVRWVYVVDLEGTHRDECFFTTDLAMLPTAIVTLYTQRWAIEVTFQEVREHLGFETTREWTKNSVLRMRPCLLGLFSVVSLAFAQYASSHEVQPAITPWYHKEYVTFSDALLMIRRLTWEELILSLSKRNIHGAKIPADLKGYFLDHLSMAA